MTNIVVFCDACVLYPAPVRDLLMELALDDLLQLKWSKKVLDEWINNLLRNRPDLERGRLKKTTNDMNMALLDCLVENYESIEKNLNLPDSNDHHVLAAAILSKSKFIVTANLKDFPNDYLALHNVESLHPDDLFMYVAHENKDKFLFSVQTCYRKLKNPPRTLDEYLLNLKNTCNLVNTVNFLENNKIHIL